MPPAAPVTIATREEKSKPADSVVMCVDRCERVVEGFPG